MIKKIQLLIFVLILVSCSKKNDDNYAFKAVSKITGKKLIITKTPSYFVKGEKADPFIVEVHDEFGNLDILAQDTATIKIKNSNVNFTGITKVPIVNGKIIFNDLLINYVMQNFQIEVSTKKFSSIVSKKLNVLDWAIQYGGDYKSSNIEIDKKEGLCVKTAIDIYGFIYCAGHTNTSFISENAGSGYDIFIIKYDPRTRKEIAKVQFGKIFENQSFFKDLSGNEKLKGLEIDNLGNMYLVGTTSSNMTESLATYSGDATDPVSIENLNKDIFIIKLNNNLKVLWVKHFGSKTKFAENDPNCVCDNSSGDFVKSTAIDDHGNLYVAGSTASDLYRDNVRSDRTVVKSNIIYARPYLDMFAFKINPLGEVQWIYHRGEPSFKDNPLGNWSYLKQQESIEGIAIHNNELYFAAKTTGEWVKGINNIATQYNILLGRLKATNGKEVMLSLINEKNDLNLLKDISADDIPVGKIAVDADGNFYVAGQTRGGLGVAKNASKIFDTFVLKANQKGQLINLYQLGGENLINASGLDTTELTRGLIIDKDQNVYTLISSKSNQFKSKVELSKYDSHILVLDKNLKPVGNNKGVYSFSGKNVPFGGNSDGDDSFLDLNIDDKGRFYISGTTNSSFASKASGNRDPLIFRVDKIRP